jgi:hypothetical protein
VWYARLFAARTEDALGEDEDAQHAYAHLLDEADASTPAWVLFEIAQYASAPGLELELVDAYRKATAVAPASDPRAASKLRARWLASAYDAGAWKECLAAAVETIPRAGDENERRAAAQAAAIALARLGGWERTPVGSVSAATQATILAAVAERALEEQHDATSAARAWSALVERTPGAVEAPIAVAGLAQAAADRGDAAQARVLVQQGARVYGFSTPWATALRAERAESAGYPSAETILRGVQALAMVPSARDTSESARALETYERARELARWCMGHRATRGALSSPASITVEVRAYVGRAAEVDVEPGASGDEIARGIRCMRSDGPGFFADAPLGARVVLELRP